MRWLLSTFCSFVLVPSLAAADEKIKVVTTLPDLARIAEAIGGADVETTSLLQGSEDPHYADAVPGFIRVVAGADVVCSMGLDLEVGWLPKVLAKSGNAKVQPGGKGYCEAGKTVRPLEVQKGRLDRSMGDVHPEGNPHFNLSPFALIEASDAITNALSQARPEKAEAFKKAQLEFTERMKTVHAKMKDRIAKAFGANLPLVIEYHRQYVYFFDAYGLQSMGSIEEKPGVLPSAGRLATISVEAKKRGAKVAFAATYTSDRSLGKFSELSGIPVKKVPAAAVEKGVGVEALEKLQLQLVDALMSVAPPQPENPAKPK